MAIAPLAFTALMTDHTAFPTDPGSEDAFRSQMQRLHSEARDYINNLILFTQEAYIAPTLINGWANFGSGSNTKYMKDSLGFVHLKGKVVTGGSSNVAIFNLPAGYRPLATEGLTLVCSSGTSFAQVVINPNGDVTPTAVSQPNVNLDNIIFRAEG